MRKRVMAGSALLTLAGATLFAQPASAQSLWNGHEEGKVAAFEWAKPNFKDSDFSAVSSALYASFRYPFLPTVSLAVELPLAYGSVDGLDDGSHFSMGNPYIGLDLRSPIKPYEVEIGLRVPMASSDNWTANAVGFFAGLPDRPEAFAPKVFVAHAIGSWVNRVPGGMSLRLRAGPMFARDGDAEEDATEWYAVYGGFASFDQGPTRFDGGVTGRYWLSADEGSFSDRSLHQLGLGVSHSLGNTRPGVYVRIPLDSDVRDAMSSVFGISVSHTLR